MESKKNPKADVGKNGSIYFAVGLALMLFLTYSTINWKTYDKSDIDIGKLNLDDELDEEIPIIEQIIPPPPPPPPPAAPEVIEVVEETGKKSKPVKIKGATKIKPISPDKIEAAEKAAIETAKANKEITKSLGVVYRRLAEIDEARTLINKQLKNLTILQKKKMP